MVAGLHLDIDNVQIHLRSQKTPLNLLETLLLLEMSNLCFSSLKLCMYVKYWETYLKHIDPVFDLR